MTGNLVGTPLAKRPFDGPQSCPVPVYNSFFCFRTAVFWELLDIRFSYKHCNFSRGCLLVKMASKTVTRSVYLTTVEGLVRGNPRDEKKESITGAGRLRECKNTECVGVEKNRILCRRP